MKTINEFMKAVGYTVQKNYRAYPLAERLLDAGLLEAEDIISMRPPVTVGRRKKYYPVKITDSAYKKLLCSDMSGIVGDNIKCLPPNPTADELIEQEKASRKPIQSEDEKLIAFAKCIRACDGCINIGMMAKILTKNGVQMTESKLFDYLRKNGFLEEVGNIKNVPTDSALTSGYFDFTEVLIEVNGHKPKINFTPKITGLGQLFILDKFGCTTDDWLPY